jgi:hypothetical protein
VFFSSFCSSLSWFASCSIVNYWSCNLPSLIFKCLCEQCCTNVYVKVIVRLDVYHNLLHKNLQPASTLEVIEFYLMSWFGSMHWSTQVVLKIMM